MIRLRVDDLTLGRVRIATSPLWEAMSSLALLSRSRGQIPHPYTRWGATALRRAPRVLHQELHTWMRTRWTTSSSSSLMPIPATSSPAIEDELTALRTAGHDRLAQLMSDYWTAAVAPYWPAMRSVLEEEILMRGRTLVTAGAATMLADLGGRIRWAPPELSIPHHADFDRPMTDGHLVIVAVLFARNTRVFSARDAVVAFSYQAQGAAVLSGLADDARRKGDGTRYQDKLTLLLGRGRAAVLRALRSPTTTTRLAGSIGLAPSTVSQHLSVLSAAGLVRRHRVGPRVIYELERSGIVLLTELGD